MDLLSWLTEHLVEELEHINKEIMRVETYSERVELRRLKHDILEELHNRGENQ